MQFEQYFIFLCDDEIRIAGTHVGIETVLFDYINPSINLEQIYATILYYLQNKERVDAHLTDWIEHGEWLRREQAKNPLPVTLRLRRLAAELDA